MAAPTRAELLRSVDGIETRTAQNILAGIGVDMSDFPSAGHLASWAGQCPGNDQSSGKRRSGRTQGIQVAARRANRRRGVTNQRHQVAQHLAERYRRPAEDVIINRVIAR